ncbi:MAG: HAMP domain-containing protein [Desulfobulbaceae bacterium]|nr:HAMP domain-containing protein [Desulfobulbaceae bacterium]
MRISLRIKLALISLLLLFIPLTGFRFSELIKQDLLESRKETMLFSARAVASALSGRTGLFDRELFHSLNASRDLYLYQLSNPMRVNGKTDDWQPQLEEAGEFGEDHLLLSTEPYNPESLHYRHLTGIRGAYLYAIFLVTDDQIVYRHANSLRLDLSDHLQIGVEDPQGNLHHYKLTAIKPGWVNAFLMPENLQETIPDRVERKIQGMWVESPGGYIVELRMPKEMVGQKLAFAIADIDDPETRKTKTLIGTAATEEQEELGWLLSPSGAIEDILESLDRPHSRVMIVDSNRRVRASFGNLAEEQATPDTDTSVLTAISSYTYRFLAPLYRFFTQSFATEFSQPTAQPSTLDIKGVKEALLGVSSVTSYAINDGQVEIMAAITPLKEQDTIIGAVVVEQTTNSILALQNKMIEESLTLTILVFSFGGFGLIFFASRLSSRIRRLGSQAASAISDSGQIRSTILPIAASDEIGDLSRTLTTMLNQLKIQTDYREKMADNLEHEMRTPLAGISASLKNMAREMDDPPEHLTNYLDWAMEDVARLESLLTAVRDATSLQEALGHDFKEDFLLDTAIDMWLIHSWQQAYPEVDFIFHRPTEPVTLHGDPGRIRQMLDKLIDNAVSFHRPGTPIEITLAENRGTHFSATLRGTVTLKVANQGPTIPAELQNQIFNSMVSYRQQKGSGPHLGLGLYIVRTIVEHHQGTVTVGSTKDAKGTVFTLKL